MATSLKEIADQAEQVAAKFEGAQRETLAELARLVQQLAIILHDSPYFPMKRR